MVEELNRMPLIGEKLPEMEVLTTHGVKKLPEDYKGKWLVIFSHPADFTPVCTTEFYAFQQRYDKFKELNTELLGLSIDQVFAHIKWEEWIKENLGAEIQFPIIADPTGEVAKKLGMLQPSASKTNTVRAVLIIDPNGVVRAILYYPPELGRNVDEILRMVKALQIADKYKVAMPHNWPNNELIKDRAIVPPAASLQEKKEREELAKKGEIQCYDWWFCHKEIKE
jgi:peroxiredoxin (alkyl hydroperoxide reductase subunit C)